MSELEYCAFCDDGYAHSGICDKCTAEIGQTGKELADKDRQLAERTRQRDAYKKALEIAEDELMTARADAEHWKSECSALQRMVHEARARIDHLERIVDEMTEEQAALCAEDQSITELVAAKDRLIEQMREALENIRDYPGHIDYTTGEVHSMQEIAIDALAAERGE